MSDLRKGPRGLPSIAHARELRAKRGATWTTRGGLLAAAAVVLGFVVHTVVSGRELSAGKEALLAKQRAVAATLGAEWFPLRDRIESDVHAAAQTAGPSYGGDRIEPAARTGAFRSQPGIYLRMRVADAGNVAKVAADAKRDAFAACLLRESIAKPAAASSGTVSGAARDAVAEQPWNLGRAYAATRILNDDWVRSVKDADEDMRLRVFNEQYENAVRDEIPVAIDVVTRAQFFLLVLDEDVPAAKEFADGGPITEEALQLVPHPAVVHLFDLKSNAEILRFRGTGDARVVPAGERAVTDPETVDAMQRQANNCALANLVTAALAPPVAAH
jgi:hypothetical protein